MGRRESLRVYWVVSSVGGTTNDSSKQFTVTSSKKLMESVTG